MREFQSRFLQFPGALHEEVSLGIGDGIGEHKPRYHARAASTGFGPNFYPEPRRIQCLSNASTQSDPAAKAKALEDFLAAYPQSVAKKAALDDLISAYQQAGDADKELGAASRMLQLEPNNMKAIYISVALKRGQCLKTSDPQTCDDAAALALKGLATPKGADSPMAIGQR